jgi:carbohydrate-selective porin OprB
MEGGHGDRAEAAIELTCLVEVAGGFSLQPDLHYILGPGRDSSLANALAVGLRSTISF